MVVAFRVLQPKPGIVVFGLTALRVASHLIDLVAVALVASVSARLLGGTIPDGLIGSILIWLESFELGDIGLLFVAACSIALRSGLSAALLYGTSMYLARLETDASVTLAGHLLTNDLLALKNKTLGQINWAVTSSSHIAFSTSILAATGVIAEGTYVILMVIFLVSVNPLVATYLLGFFLVLVIVYEAFVARRQTRLGQRIADNAVRVTDIVLEMASAFRELKASGTVTNLLLKLRRIRSQHARDHAKNRFLLLLPKLVLETGVVLGLVIALGVLSFLENPEDLFVTLAVYALAGIRIATSIVPLQNAVQQLRTLAPQADEARKNIVLASDFSGIRLEEPPEELFPMMQRGPRVEIERVSLEYPLSERKALDSISLDIPSGSRIALVGPSGSGKSSLLDILLGVLRPASGTVALDGLPPDDYISLAKGQVSYVPQKVALLRGSVGENISLSFGAVDYDRARVWSLLKELGLEEVIANLPQGLDSSVGNQLDAFSVGQIQRLGVARALYRKPRLLILDEPTSALDETSEYFVERAILDLPRDVTIVMAAHRLGLVRKFDQVVGLESGRLQHEGPPSRFL